MIVRIFVTINVYIYADIPIELQPKLEKKYAFEYYYSNLTQCDIMVAYDNGSITIKHSDTEMSCDEQEFDYVFVTVIEDIAVRKSNNPVYHGSAVVYNNAHTLSFVGNSGSGKTTIVDILEKYSSNFKRISDDLLFVDGTRLYKNYLPTKTRINNDVTKMGLKSIKPSASLDYTVPGDMFDLSIVVSVNYSSSGINSFNRLNTFESIETLLCNSRRSPNNFELMKSITKIAQSIPIYSLNYNDDCYAVKCLFDALGLRNAK